MKYRFLALFILLLAMILVYPALYEPGPTEVLANLLLTLVYLGGAWVVFADAGGIKWKLVLALPAILGAWLNYFLPGGLSAWTSAVFFHGAGAAFQLLVVIVLLRAVYRERDITVDAIFAALCGYLLVGTVFSHAYCVVEAMNPGSFKGDFFDATPGREHVALTYFSFITLSTVGYGDIVPVSRHARSLAMLQAIVGQFYIAVLVADLIGKRISQTSRP